MTHSLLTSTDFEGSLDNKAIKYRIVALAVEGQGAVLKFGDESDFDVEDGIGFPPIPPVLPASRLPKLVYNTNVRKLVMKKFHFVSLGISNKFFFGNRF